MPNKRRHFRWSRRDICHTSRQYRDHNIFNLGLFKSLNWRTLFSRFFLNCTVVPYYLQYFNLVSSPLNQEVNSKGFLNCTIIKRHCMHTKIHSYMKRKRPMKPTSCLMMQMNQRNISLSLRLCGCGCGCGCGDDDHVDVTFLLEDELRVEETIIFERSPSPNSFK